MSKKTLTALGIVFAMSTALWSSAYAGNAGVATYRVADPAITALVGKGARIGHHRATGRVNFVGFDAGNAQSVSGAVQGLQAEQNAMAVLQQYGSLFGIIDPGTELQLMKQFTTDNGRAMVRYQQIYNGLPVIGAELIVNLNGQGQMLSLNGEASSRLTLGTEPVRSPSQAVETALASVAKHHQLAAASLATSTPVLSIYDPRLLGPNTFPASLVWQLEVTAKSVGAPVREYVLVDAMRGNIVLQFNQIHQAKSRETYTANNGTPTLPGTLVCDEADGDACSSGANPDADAAHLYAGDTYDFFSVNHLRDSLDGAGMTLISTVEYGVNYQNAYWDGSQMVYGDGFSLADDVVGHELTHGVTSNTSNLFYYYQSGAINESFSDVWGEFVDLSNGGVADTPAVRWLMGEDIPGLGAIRSMSDPTVYGDPDRMTHANYNATGSDNGGVHTNSGINNKAVFLLTDGGTFNGKTIDAMGIIKVAKIYYEVQTSLLTSASDYLDLYNGLYQACQNLVGADGIISADCTNVRNASQAVEMQLEPSVDFNPEAEVCPEGETVVSSFYDDIESGLTNWTFSHDAGLANIDWMDWYVVYGPTYGPYATSGLHSLFGFNTSNTADQYANISVTVPDVSGHTPYLHFKHAYSFEAGSYDGGVVEYSTNGGTTWIDASSLIDSGRDYNGTVDSGWGNPLGGRNAFVNDSHGYVSTRVDLSTLAGQSVDFRWRVGTDSLVESLGWFLDDVRVYHCNAIPGAVTLVSPSDGASDIDATSVTFKWRAAKDSDGDTLTHELQVCTDNSFTTGCITPVVASLDINILVAGIGGGGLLLLGLTGMSMRRKQLIWVVPLYVVISLLAACGGGGGSSAVAVPPSSTTVDGQLTPGTTYYWKVTASDGIGGVTDSETWSFTTAP